MKKQIRRRCGCEDCGLITEPGMKYIHGHNRKNKKHTKASKKKMSLGQIGNTNGKGR